MRSRTLPPLVALVAASVSCLGLLVIRREELGAVRYGFLAWNLALAWVPLLLALLLVGAARGRRRTVELAALALAWLVFLPNSPYVLTDFIHVGSDHRLFDTIVVGSFASTALALGFGSMLLVQGLVTRARGAALGWAVAAAALAVSSVGIYVGRVQRLNSWDVLVRPGRLAAILRGRLEDPLADPHRVLIVAALCGFLMLAYVACQAVSSLAAAARDDSR